MCQLKAHRDLKLSKNLHLDTLLKTVVISWMASSNSQLDPKGPFSIRCLIFRGSFHYIQFQSQQNRFTVFLLILLL
jgi:hypothetical protein